MPILLIIALLLRILSNPLANVFQKQLGQEGIPALFINLVTYSSLAILCLFALPFMDWSVCQSGFWLYAILAGVMGAFGNGLLIKAFEKGDLSVLGPINSYKAIVSMVFGVFLLGELPSIGGLLGVALIIGGSYFVLDTTAERFSWRLLKNREIQYRIGAMVIAAIEAVFIKKAILYSSVACSFVTWCFLGAISALVIAKVMRVSIKQEVERTTSNQLYKYVLLVMCIGVMQLTTNYVFENMNVGYALSLFQLSVIVSIFLGYKIFKESEIKKKLLGAVIMIAGSVVIIWS